MKPPRHLVLLGTAGAGKSTLADMFAGRLGCRLIRLDDDISSAAAKTIEEIFSSDGEKAFRELEARALRDALERAPAVIDPGGGVLERKENRDLLISSPSDRCYLNVAVDELLARIGDDASRPMYRAPDPSKRLRELHARRDGHFRGVATFEVEVGGRQPCATTFARVCEQLDWC